MSGQPPLIASDLPAEITVEPLLPSGSRFILPPHGFRKTGLAMIVFGVIELCFMVFWTSGWMAGFQAMFGDWGLASAVVAVPGFIGGIALLGIGTTLMFGHCEIEVDPDVLRWIECVGPFRWHRSRPIASVRRLSVETTQAHSQYEASSPNSGSLTAIKVETTGKPWMIALAYDRALLVPLATRLATECNAVAAELGMETIVDVVEISDGPSRRTEQPTGSQIVCEKLEDGVTFNIPPAGLRKGSSGLFTFSILWCGFMTVFTTIVLFAEKPGGGELWLMLLFAAAFWLIGIGMMLSAVNMGRRRAAIAVVGNSVMALQTSLFRSRSAEWQSCDIQAIRVGPSGMEVNDQPVLQLQIVPTSGKTFGLLSGRDVAELEWMATLLGDALKGRPDATSDK